MATPQTYTGNGLTVTIADPENITKDECLRLARAGSDVWNGWRKEFPVRLVGETHLNTADFSNTVFREKALAFNNFHFGDFANFREATFSESTFFVDAVLGLQLIFTKHDSVLGLNLMVRILVVKQVLTVPISETLRVLKKRYF